MWSVRRRIRPPGRCRRAGGAGRRPARQAEAARRRAAAAADPDAATVLDALAATRAELAALPTPDVPPEVAARWAAALAAESRRAPTGTAKAHVTFRGSAAVATRVPVTASPGGGRTPRAAAPGGGRGRHRRGRRRIGALVHRARTRRHPRRTRRARPVGRRHHGRRRPRPPARRVACLRAVAPAAAEEALLGGRRVVLDGRPGVLLVLATGTPGGLRIVTVDPRGCGPDGGTLRAQLVVE